MTRRWRWGRSSSIGALAVLLLSAAWSDQKRDAAPPGMPQKDFDAAPQHPVLRVVSGDTVIVRVAGKGQRVGLIGVSALPVSQPGGREARRFLQNLLEGESAYVEYADEDSSVDDFGRTPAFLYRAPDGLFVNLELVRQGYAAVPSEPGFAHHELFRHYEARARQAEKGRWGRAAEPAEQATPQAAAEVGKEATEEVIVYVTAQGKKYHRADCYHLRKSAIPIKLSEAKTRGYEPCSQCKPPR